MLCGDPPPGRSALDREARAGSHADGLFAPAQRAEMTRLAREAEALFGPAGEREARKEGSAGAAVGLRRSPA
jgi:hypothetical protein